jgi:pimeloyl-ACP methyl ester carboxylesterase
MDQLAADVLALLEVAGVQEADLLGYSMGGLVALWTTVLSPARVRSLVAGGVSNQPREWMAIGPPLRGASPMTPEAEASRQLALQVPGNDLEALAACLEAGPGPPPCPELAVFGGEALIAVGTRDPHFEASRAVAQCLPGGRFLPLEDDDHNGAFADPRFKKAVAEFLEEVSPP